MSNATDDNEIETYVCGQNEGEDQSTCQECFTRKLFGLPGHQDHRDTQPGDTLLLYDYGNKNTPNTDDKFIYGPFTAESEVQRELVPEAWEGDFPNQVRVSWDQLYRLPEEKAPINMWDDFVITGDDAQALMEALLEEGIKIQVTENGAVEPIDEPEPEDEDEEDEVDDEEDETDTEEDDDSEGIRDIVELREMAEPLPRVKDVKEDPNPGAAMIREAVTGELRPELYEQALVHLIAGKNVIFYGPPGSGKTRIAERLGESLCSTLHVETANAEWTNQDVVGGYRPENNGFEPTPGILTEAAASCAHSLEKADPPHPAWLLIDELNRANLDEAFGEVFTLLDLSYRDQEELTYADNRTQQVPLAFRILGTMNSEDQAQLFALGYAFRRRFAFIEVPPIYQQSDWDIPDVRIDAVDLDPEFEETAYILERATTNGFDHKSSVEHDSALAIPYLEEVFDVTGEFSEVADEEFLNACSTISPPGSDLSFDRAILSFVQKLDEQNVAAIGQGIIIDTYKYILLYQMLFPDSVDWAAVDQAVVSYIVPQLEAYMPELRRAGTVAAESGAVERFDNVIAYAEEIGFTQTAARLKSAKETHEIIG